jgi:ATP-dependent DNA helicase RecG
MRYRVIIDGTQLQRKEIPEVPHAAIREALYNSFCHKNFRTPQNNEVAIFKDRIEIYNPGTFPEGITPADFIKGKGRPVHRNPLLVQIMYYSKDIERFGTGLKRIADACDEACVRYEFVSDNYGFTVIFYRPPLWTSDKLEENLKVNVGEGSTGNPDTNYGTRHGKVTGQYTNHVPVNVPANVSVSKTASALFALITEDPTATYETLSAHMKLDRRTVQRNIRILKDAGLLRRVGSDKNGYWEVTGG